MEECAATSSVSTQCHYATLPDRMQAFSVALQHNVDASDALSMNSNHYKDAPHKLSDDEDGHPRVR